MTTIYFDGTFMGWLTAVFNIYEGKFTDVKFESSESNQLLFAYQHVVITDEAKAKRVWEGLLKHISNKAAKSLYVAFLSELPGIEEKLLLYMKDALASKQSIETNFSKTYILEIAQIARKVQHEKHRMEEFVRFQLTQDELYYSIIEPEYNVLPLVSNHFKNRYADQRWLIYDGRRKYGIYYDLADVSTVQLNFNEATNNGTNIISVVSESEYLYQKLWQGYFNSVNIKARKNIKLHLQHMPKKYWKYLPEKNQL